ncbi:MAG: cytochrome c3 family protein [Planctomycetota bacterium]|jgi:hypothetical protein
MKLRIILPLILMVPLSLAACAILNPDNARTGKVKLVYSPDGDNALDVILLGDQAFMVGTFLFSHKLHHSPEDSGGYGIACDECHHNFEGKTGVPPKNCRECHFTHETDDAPSI